MNKKDSIDFYLNPLLNWDFIYPQYTEKQKKEMITKIKEIKQERNKE